MNKSLFDRIVQQLLPEMGDTGARKALIESALFESPVLAHIEWSGAAKVFTVRVIKRLYDYDPSALTALLTELKTQVGSTRQAEIDQLIRELTSPTSNAKGHKTMEPAILIAFLIEVGRWAKSELSERWKLRRDQQEADLTKAAEAEATLPTQIESIVQEKSPRDVERIMTLIERKRDAIFRARSAKLADREEYDAQRLMKAAFEQREAEHNKTIKQMLNEIEDDLQELGFEVERESV